MFERRNFLVLRPVLLKNAYFNSANPELSKGVQLVELRKEKLLIPLAAQHKAQSSDIFLVFSPKN